MKKIFMILAAIVVIIGIGFLIAASYYLYSGPYVLNRCTENEEFDFRIFYSQLDEFIARHHDPALSYDPYDICGGFSIDAGGESDLYGAVDMVYVLWILDELEARTTAEGRAQWAAVIQAYQNPETGYFDRGNDSGESATHATAFASAALKLLGYDPLYPHHWAGSIFSSPENINAWLNEFDWDQIWTGSHDAGAVAAIIDAPGGLELPVGWGDWVLQAFSERMDEKTGFWKNGVLDPVLRGPTTVDLGGAAHFWWIYDHMGRPIPYPQKAVKGILKLQRRTGLWGARVFNGAYPQGIDFDALNGFRLALKSVTPQYREEIKDDLLTALDRYACVAEYHLNRPGSVEELFHSSHKIVGTLNALAELDLLYLELTGRRKLNTPKSWRSALTEVCWQ